MYAIRVDHIDKRYGSVEALKGATFDVTEGELFGLIGSDGAGKSTLMRILASLLAPDQGHATVGGLDSVRDYRTLRCQLGYMPGRFSLYGDLTVNENLQFFASVFGTTIEQNRSLIDDIYLSIEPFGKRRASRLSGGMKQKLALCCALIHAPQILLLDEPTTGVDPVSRRELWEMLGRLRNRGITIVVTTPYMDEASRCDRMAFIREGSILHTATPVQTIASFGEALYAIRSDRMHQLLDDLRATEGVTRCYSFGQTHHFTLHQHTDPQAIAQHLQSLGYSQITISRVTPSIEDCYLKLAMS